jgi:hypothetical protein
MITVPAQVDPTISGGREYSNKEIKEKQEAVVEAKQQTSEVLEEVSKISKKQGKEIQEIKAGDLHISTKELSVNEIMLKAKENLGSQNLQRPRCLYLSSTNCLEYTAG